MTPCPPEQAPDAAPGGGTAGGPPTGEGDVRTIEGAARVSGQGARTSGAFTQESDEAGVFGRLRGSWEGSGTLFGSPARFSMRWDTTDGLARLHFSNALEEEGGGTTPVLTAFATYRTAEPAEGIWLDSRGETLMLTWTQDGDALVVSWRSLEESGRTTYRTLTEDAVEVLDEVSTPDGFSVFGRARYTRVAPAP